jgi:Gas vesicle synthesis protein GvpL/GvpF
MTKQKTPRKSQRRAAAPSSTRQKSVARGSTSAPRLAKAAKVAKVAKAPKAKLKPRPAVAKRAKAPRPRASGGEAPPVRSPRALRADNGVAVDLASAGLGGSSAEDVAHLGVHGLGPGPESLWSTHGASEGSGKYVYCIMQTTTPLRFGAIGIGSEPAEVHTVNYRDIAAVVSDTPLEVYDPTRENVLAHERVNEAVMRKYTVIPMSFNTVFKTREDIIELLRSAYEAFHDVLGKMVDKLEFGLKVVWDPELVIREIEKENDNLRLLRQEISSRKGSTYFARMQYGRLVDSLLQDRSDRLVNEIFSTLSGVAVAARANKPIGDKMILNAAFLVARDREGDFDGKVKEIDSRYAYLKFKYTGPWPPYNFVNIRLKLERAAEAD